jgi:hypothetical protein
VKIQNVKEAFILDCFKNDRDKFEEAINTLIKFEEKLNKSALDFTRKELEEIFKVTNDDNLDKNIITTIGLFRAFIKYNNIK